jgi:DUF1365 family protein
MTRADFIEGQTYHGRKGDIANAFRYSVDYVLLDAEAPTETLNAILPRLFRRNTGGLASLHDSDHGGAPSKGSGAKWVRQVLAANDLACEGKIELLAQPRMLGRVFNPVSFWLCYDAKGQLRTVIAEVSNTYGDRHSYLCHHSDQRPILPTDRLRARKVMHVSPFQPVEGGYEFRFDISDKRIGIFIDYTSQAGGLIATLTGARKPLTNRTILKSCLRRPLGSRRVLGLIHWQALKLFLKKAGFRNRPDAPGTEVS